MNKSPFGLLAFLQWNHDWNNYHFPEETLERAAEQIQALGVGMVRMDIVWSDIHTGPGKYDFSRYDRLLSILGKYDYEILGMLQYNKVRLDSSGKALWNLPPDSFEEFAAYVESTVSRYKSKIHHWEVWNEPNHPVYWAVPRDGLKNYTRLLQASYKAAKKADPACTVLNGGITEPIVEDVTNLYNNGGKNAFDVLAIHTFLDPLDPNSERTFDKIITQVRGIMVKHGDAAKKIWITEMGCPGMQSPEKAKDWWAGKNLSEEQQANWLEKQYAMMKKYPDVEKLFWAFYRDTPNIFEDGVDYFGLVRNDFSPKPSFERMNELIKGKRS